MNPNNNNDTMTLEELPVKQEQKLQKFMKLLHRRPAEEDVRTSQISDELKYLPISRVEMLLDELYFGLWELHDFEYYQLGMRHAAQLRLRVFHPVAKVWLSRIGVATISIDREIDSQEEEEADNSSGNILSHLKAECIKNAARTLGKAFGRDLNRNDTSDYQPIIPENGNGQAD